MKWKFLLLGCFGLLFNPIQANSDELLERCLVVGDSKDAVLNIIRENGDCFDFEYDIEGILYNFIGKKYGAGAWGLKPGKTLINIHELNCVTFIETAWAILLTKRWLATHPKAQSDEELLLGQFVSYLDNFRYYNGVNCVWEDRITYFTDQLYQMQDAGLLYDVAAQNGFIFDKKIHYISSNKKKFSGFTNWDRISKQEERLNARKKFYYPIHEYDRYAAVAKTGDIIALATNVAGLDVSHCGFISRDNDELKFSHASMLKKKVVFKEDFCSYLGNRTTITGFFVFRPAFATSN